MPRISHVYFRTAIIFLVFGVLLGLWMSINQDFGAVAAHAHINLLGWVTSAIFGGYYALNPDKAGTKLAWIQYTIYTGGIAVMLPSLYFMILGHPALHPLVAIGSVTAFAGILLFLVIVFMGSHAIADDIAPSPLLFNANATKR
jgi:hypothetical protein